VTYEVKLNQTGVDLFQVSYVGDDGEPRFVNFVGKDAEERARDFAGALQIFLDHTEPGETMTGIFEAIFHSEEEDEGGDRDVVELR